MGRAPVAAALRALRGGRTWVAVSAASFAALSALAAFGDLLLLRIDGPIQRAIIGTRRGWLDEAMTGVSRLGTRYVIGALLAALAVWVLATGRCRVTLFVLLVAFALNPVLDLVLKAAIDRPRPDLLLLGRGRGPSFPSGHVLASVGFYAMLPVLAWEATARWWARATALTAATAVVLAVGFSRIYLGVHWFTDVVGGYLLGAVVVTATYRALGGHRLDRSRACCSRGPEAGHRSRSPAVRAR